MSEQVSPGHVTSSQLSNYFEPLKMYKNCCHGSLTSATRREIKLKSCTSFSDGPDCKYTHVILELWVCDGWVTSTRHHSAETCTSHYTYSSLSLNIGLNLQGNKELVLVIHLFIQSHYTVKRVRTC